MKNLFLFVAFIVSYASLAQYQLTIDALVLDKDNKEPIPYVNIEVKNKAIKSISDTNGNLILKYDETAVQNSDIIVFSHLSYEKLEVKAVLLYKLLANSNKIYLKPKAFIKQSNQDDRPTISGTVFNVNGSIQSATVRVKNTLSEVQTNSDGSFEIVADEEDILEINYLGMLPKEVIADPTRTMRIELLPDSEMLDEIALKGKAKQNIVETGYGKRNKDGVGVAVNTLTADDINPGATRLADVIVGKFAGVRVAGLNVAYNSPKFIIRGGGGSLAIAYAMFDIDGIIYSSSQDIPYIDVQTIESISILKSISATNKYGTLGRGGAILIKTKTFQNGKDSKPIDNGLVKGNDYIEKITLLDHVKTKSDITTRLEKAKSYEEAIQIYTGLLQEKNSESITFYLDASDYFKRWDQEFSTRILETATNNAYANVKALKAIAYKLEEYDKFGEAKLIYQRIAELRPDDIQSYRDLALIYKAAGDYAAAMDLYLKMLRNEISDIDFSPLGNVIVNEVQHLVAHHRQDVNYKALHPDLLSVTFKKDIRIVFDWNDPKVEFELQFVNPQKKFFKWAHTKFDNFDRMQHEVEFGFHSEEYIIDDAESGEWLINIETLSEQDLINPTYLKYTVYKNYGLSTEEKTVKVLKLFKQSQQLTLDKFIYQ